MEKLRCCWYTSSATSSMVLSPGMMPYLNVPRAEITWSPLAVAREWPTKALTAVTGHCSMAKAAAMRSRISDSVTRLAGVLEPWAWTKLRWRTASMPSSCTALATALATVR
ncbi:hypothetical protein D9M68_777910 [compost metagenome]